MSLTYRALIASVLLGFTFAVGAFDSNIPEAGLPSASHFSASVLPDLQGVVSWKTLAQVEPVKEGSKMVPRFTKEILALDRQSVRVQGFMQPLDLGDHQKHFLILATPPECPFCLPAGPDAIVEVFTKKAVAFGYEPVIVSGKMAVLKDDPSGVLYRVTDAETIETRGR